MSRRTDHGGADRAEAGQRVLAAVHVEHGQLGTGVRVPHGDAGGEPVALRLGERVGAFHLDRVLGGDHHERGLQQVGHPVDGDLPLLHRLQQRGLGLRRRPVDLVADHDVREHRARLELEVARLLVVDADPGDVAGQQVRSELDPAHRAVDRTGQRLGQLGLANPGDVLDEQVTLGEQDREGQPHGGVLALDDLLDVVDDRVCGGGELSCRHRRAQIARRTWDGHGHPPRPPRAVGPRAAGSGSGGVSPGRGIRIRRSHRPSDIGIFSG